MTTHNNAAIGRREESGQNGGSVSLFSGYSDVKPKGVIPLTDFLLQPTFKEKVEEIRLCNDKSRRRELKSKLPAITPSGVFSKRCNVGLIRHSGYICIDIDGQDNPAISDWNGLKTTVSEFPGLWYAGLSASGNGLFLIIHIANPDKHLAHFNAIENDLEHYGLTVDSACKDVARLRGASYDPVPFFNPDAIPYTNILTTTTPKCNMNDTRISVIRNDISGRTVYRVARLVDTIERSGANIADYYPDWYAIGRSLASEFGQSGRGWFHAISRQSAKYDPTECDAQYTRCLAACSQTSISTLFWYCQKNGISAKG